jgi:hypothetical protein
VSDSGHDIHRDQVLSITDDFVVYPVDMELADLDRNMTACLPADRLALLRERGYR